MLLFSFLYISFTGALFSYLHHGACTILLCCLIFPSTDSKLAGSKKLLQMATERPAHSSKLIAARWDSRRTSLCLFRWELSTAAPRSPQTSQGRAAMPQPRFAAQDGWAFLWTAELQIPLLAKQPWQVGRGGKRKSCSANNVLVGVCV